MKVLSLIIFIFAVLSIADLTPVQEDCVEICHDKYPLMQIESSSFDSERNGCICKSGNLLVFYRSVIPEGKSQQMVKRKS